MSTHVILLNEGRYLILFDENWFWLWGLVQVIPLHHDLLRSVTVVEWAFFLALLYHVYKVIVVFLFTG